MNRKHDPAMAKAIIIISLSGHTLESRSLRVKDPTRTRKMLPATIYGIAWMSSGLVSAKVFPPALSGR